MKNELPSFFNDESESDKYESLVDFWLSWTLRCANICNLEEHNKKIGEYSKRILSYCLTKKQDPHFLDGKKIKDIKCWKYFSTGNGQIDLWFEITIDETNYVLIFENKVYARLDEGQLEKYKSSINEFYKDKNVEIIFIFFRAHDDFLENDQKYCDKNDFVPILFTDLQNLMGEKELTENDLFDEFWFRW